MLAKRIIPCFDVKEGRVVKGINFVNLRDAGDPVEQAEIYDRDGADEIVFLDITASHEKRRIIIDVVHRTAERIFVPLTVGGGIRDIDDIRDLLNAGADKVSINTAAVLDVALVQRAARRFGSQCIVVAVDARLKNGSWEVYIHGGRTPTGIDALDWARTVQQQGAGEILLTSMDCDGTCNGYDIELTRRFSDTVDIPIIASGGAGHPEHLYDVLTAGQADAALAASIFHYGTWPLPETKKYLKEKGIEVRE